MSEYQSFTSTRTTEPDLATLLAQLRALDASAVVAQHVPGTPAYVLGKATAWTPPQLAAAQAVLDTAPATSPQLTAQSNVDAWPIELKAAFLLVMEQFNVLRALQVPALPAFTVPQFLAAIRAKAGTGSRSSCPTCPVSR